MASYLTKLKKRTQVCCGWHKHARSGRERNMHNKRFRRLLKQLDVRARLDGRV